MTTAERLQGYLKENCSSFFESIGPAGSVTATARPYLTWQQVEAEREITIDGYVVRRWAIFRVDIWAKTYKEATFGADLVAAALDLLNDEYTYYSEVSGPMDIPVPDFPGRNYGEYFRKQLEVKIYN